MDKFDAVWFGNEIRDCAKKIIPKLECDSCLVKDLLHLGIRENSVNLGKLLADANQKHFEELGNEDGLIDLVASVMVIATIQASIYYISNNLALDKIHDK